MPELELSPPGDGDEARGWAQLEGDAGEVIGDLVEAEVAFALGGIVNACTGTGDLAQHHEMVEVPVEDGGQLQIREGLQVELEGARGKPELVGHAHQGPQGGAGERGRKALTQGVEIEIMAMEARDHGQTGKSALGAFGSFHGGDAPRARQDDLGDDERGHLTAA